MESRQLLLKALSILTQVSAGHSPSDDEVTLLKQNALPHEESLQVDALARAIIRRESLKDKCDSRKP